MRFDITYALHYYFYLRECEHMKSVRNKTIELSDSDVGKYLSRCISAGECAQGGDAVCRTVFGDSLEAMRGIPRASVDLMIADPYYNLNKSFNSDAFSKMTDSEYERYTRSWIESALPLLKPTASVYVCCDWRSGMVICRVLGEHLVLRNRITWQREKGRGARSNWKNSMEDIWFATVSDKYVFHPERVMMRRRVLAPYRSDGKPRDWEQTDSGRFRNTYPSNFWDDISVPYWSMAENTPHPAQKPEKLMAKLILASSEENDIVFDPFLGSGTVSVVAKKLSRRYIGIERDPFYCALAEYRLSLSETDRRIQGYEDGVFWERNSLSGSNKK